MERERERNWERERKELPFCSCQLPEYIYIYICLFVFYLDWGEKRGRRSDKSIDIGKPMMDIFHFTPQIHFPSFILPGALGGCPYGLHRQFPFLPFFHWVWLVEDIGKRPGEQEESKVRIFIPSSSQLCSSTKGHRSSQMAFSPQLTFLVPVTTSSPHSFRLGCRVVMDPCPLLCCFS